MILIHGSFPFGKDGCGVVVNCSLGGTNATLFPFRQIQFVQVFPLKPASFCKLSAGLSSTKKSAISLLLVLDSRSVLATLSTSVSFLFPQTLWHIRQELSSLFYFTIMRQMNPDTPFSWPGGVRYSCLLQCLVISALTSCIHPYLSSDKRRTVSSKFFDT